MSDSIDRITHEPQSNLERLPEQSEIRQPIADPRTVIEREAVHDEYDKYLIEVWENEGGAANP